MASSFLHLSSKLHFTGDSFPRNQVPSVPSSTFCYSSLSSDLAPSLEYWSLSHLIVLLVLALSYHDARLTVQKALSNSPSQKDTFQVLLRTYTGPITLIL